MVVSRLGTLSHSPMDRHHRNARRLGNFSDGFSFVQKFMNLVGDFKRNVLLRKGLRRICRSGSKNVPQEVLNLGEGVEDLTERAIGVHFEQVVWRCRTVTKEVDATSAAETRQTRVPPVFRSFPKLKFGKSGWALRTRLTSRFQMLAMACPL